MRVRRGAGTWQSLSKLELNSNSPSHRPTSSRAPAAVASLTSSQISVSGVSALSHQHHKIRLSPELLRLEKVWQRARKEN